MSISPACTPFAISQHVVRTPGHDPDLDAITIAQCQARGGGIDEIDDHIDALLFHTKR